MYGFAVIGGGSVELSTARVLINYAGLYSDRVAALGGVEAGNRMKHP
jgi:L-2-hydroxyglutarate oxidase LhgO